MTLSKTRACVLQSPTYKGVRQCALRHATSCRHSRSNKSVCEFNACGSEVRVRVRGAW